MSIINYRISKRLPPSDSGFHHAFYLKKTFLKLTEAIFYGFATGIFSYPLRSIYHTGSGSVDTCMSTDHCRYNNLLTLVNFGPLTYLIPL